MPRLPAEWEPQTAVMLTWPHGATDWADDLAAVEALYERIAAAIAPRQQVLIVCHNESQREQVRKRLAAAGVATSAVLFCTAPSNDTWARDHGPITVIDDDGSACLMDFRFNGWGGKYAADLDDRITTTLHGTGCFDGAHLRTSPLVLEGGAIDSDGNGSLLVVRRTLIDPARNPDWSQQEIEAELCTQLGADRLLWLEHGQLSGDDTDGHIDTLARFCDTETICFVESTDPSHPDHAELLAMQQELQALRQPTAAPTGCSRCRSPARSPTAMGNTCPPPMPTFLIINGAVLAPIYDDPADSIALDQLRRAFPGREMLPDRLPSADPPGRQPALHHDATASGVGALTWNALTRRQPSDPGADVRNMTTSPFPYDLPQRPDQRDDG
jgi:agmatine/peptidylarginine deiminase